MTSSWQSGTIVSVNLSATSDRCFFVLGVNYPNLLRASDEKWVVKINAQTTNNFPTSNCRRRFEFRSEIREEALILVHVEVWRRFLLAAVLIFLEVFLEEDRSSLHRVVTFMLPC